MERADALGRKRPPSPAALLIIIFAAAFVVVLVASRKRAVEGDRPWHPSLQGPCGGLLTVLSQRGAGRRLCPFYVRPRRG